MVGITVVLHTGHMCNKALFRGEAFEAQKKKESEVTTRICMEKCGVFVQVLSSALYLPWFSN